MRALNAVRRIVILVLLIPIVAICLDTLLRAFGAREQNPIVSTVRDIYDFFVLDAFTNVFPDQNYWQTALVALAAYGILMLVVVSLFRGLRSIVASRPPAQRPRPAPAANTSKRDDADEQAASTKKTTAASREPERTDGASAQAPAEDGQRSSS